MGSEMNLARADLDNSSHSPSIACIDEHRSRFLGRVGSLLADFNFCSLPLNLELARVGRLEIFESFCLRRLSGGPALRRATWRPETNLPDWKVARDDEA